MVARSRNIGEDEEQVIICQKEPPPLFADAAGIAAIDNRNDTMIVKNCFIEPSILLSSILWDRGTVLSRPTSYRYSKSVT